MHTWINKNASNGPISALLSFVRTIVFQLAFVLPLPLIWELDGIWWSVIATEVMATLVSVIFILAYDKRYKYIKD